MILTGKAKTDFKKFFYKNVVMQSTLTYQQLFYSNNEEYLFAEILKWLDSVSIHVGVLPYLELMKGNINANVFRVYLCYSLHSVWANRQEATRAAVEAANEIYNKQK